MRSHDGYPHRRWRAHHAQAICPPRSAACLQVSHSVQTTRTNPLLHGVADNLGCDSKFSLLVRRLQKRPNKGTSDRGEDGAGDRSRKA